jgi:hypothetical protein
MPELLLYNKQHTDFSWHRPLLLTDVLPNKTRPGKQVIKRPEDK